MIFCYILLGGALCYSKIKMKKC